MYEGFINKTCHEEGLLKEQPVLNGNFMAQIFKCKFHECNFDQNFMTLPFMKNLHETFGFHFLCQFPHDRKKSGAEIPG